MPVSSILLPLPLPPRSIELRRRGAEVARSVTHSVTPRLRASAHLQHCRWLSAREFGFVLQSTTQANGGDPHEAGVEPQAPSDRIAAALDVIPNNADWDQWNAVGMATWRATGGSGEGLAAFDTWSKKSPKYNAHTTAQKWAAFFRSPTLETEFKNSTATAP